jgi:hypothetical protein
VADEKTELDPDKTLVQRETPAQGPSPAPPARDSPPAEVERTVIMRRPQAPAAAVPDADATIIKPIAPPRAAHDTDHTTIRSMPSPPTAATATAFELVGLSPELRGRRFPIPGDEALVGSNPSCHVVLMGAEGVHAKLVRSGGSFEIHNVGSPGSIIAGGRKITVGKLESGDLLKIGDAVVRLVKSGEVFSSSYSPSELAPSGFARFLDPAFLKANPRYALIGGLAVLVVVVALWPSSPSPKRPQKSAVRPERDPALAKRIDSLIAAGEVLFNAGKLVSPDDHPEAESALRKFDEALSLDPGNEKALGWLGRVDAEQKRQKTARDEADAEERRARTAAEERDRIAREEADTRERSARDEAERQRVAQEEEERRRAADALAAKVSVALAEGDKLFDRGLLTEPAGRNALERYREAQKIDPESATAKERIDRVIRRYLDLGDAALDRDDQWAALESYRKASRAMGGTEESIQARIQDVEARIRSRYGSGDTLMIVYKDERGKLVVVDDKAKVPPRYLDRAVEIQPGAGGAAPSGGF